jgi:hypothetical protein
MELKMTPEAPINDPLFRASQNTQNKIAEHFRALKHAAF